MGTAIRMALFVWIAVRKQGSSIERKQKLNKHGTGGQTMTRDELVEKIELIKQAIMFAGPVHRRDLQKHLKRMLAQLAEYDRFQAAAKQGVG